MRVDIDQICGKILLGQKIQEKQICLGGLMPNQPCGKSSDCGPSDYPGKCHKVKGYKGCVVPALKSCSVLQMDQSAVMAL